MALGSAEGEIVGSFVCQALTPEGLSLNPLDPGDE